MTEPPTSFSHWAQHLRHLHECALALAPTAAHLEAPSPQEQPWFELLTHKLLPQTQGEVCLVVAVVGGTNIGKSVLFNQLAGQNASGVSPLAAGTKHPVCLVPAAWNDGSKLGPFFEGFSLRPWKTPEDPLAESDEHLLFWRRGENVPDRLLLLDTPDIDSDAQINWQRAEFVRQAADVVVAVLTQQKYNDAAVKQFFRRAAETDTPAIVVFNQCDLEEDAEYWPQWLDVFREATGVEVLHVYVVPYDRQAAKSLELPFYPLGPDGRQAPANASALRDELAALHFDELKLRTLRGAMAEVLDSEHGVPAYLDWLTLKSGQFAQAAAALESCTLPKVPWPPLPRAVLIDEIADWWNNTHREGWTRRIHSGYRAVGKAVVWPFRKAKESIAGPAPDPLEEFQRDEKEALVRSVELMFKELERLADVGNDLLRPRLENLLRGEAREDLLERLERDHAQLPAVGDDYRRFLHEHLQAWTEAHPKAKGWIKGVDRGAALMRPAISVALGLGSGTLLVDRVVDASAQFVIHATAETVTSVALTAEGAAAVAGFGISRTVAILVGELLAEYGRQRAAWLGDWLEREVLGNLLQEIRQGAEATSEPAFRQMREACDQLRGVLAQATT